MRITKLMLLGSLLGVQLFNNAQAAAPVVNLVRPTNGASFGTRSSILLRANASVSDGTLSSIDFFAGTNLLKRTWSTLTNGFFEFRWSNAPAGMHQLHAEAEDNVGDRGVSASVQITVTNSPPPNSLPLVSLIQPPNASVFWVGTPILLRANASDSDGTLTNIEFFANANLVGSISGTLTNGVYSLMWSNPVPGMYSVRAEAVDDAGGRGASAPVQVAVSEVTNNCQVSITVPPGFSMIANQCNNTNVGGNTLNNLYPGVPAGCKITKWDQAGQVFEPAAVFNGGVWSPNFTLNPGEGAFFENPTASPITLTSSGATPAPNLPLALPSSGCSIVSRQQPLVGGYNDIVGLAPQPGDLVFRFVSGIQAYFVYVFDELDLTWYRNAVPDAPMANVGESIWVCRGVAPPSPNSPPPNNLPLVSLIQPPNASVFSVGTPILLRANASDSDGTITNIEFFANANLVGSISGTLTNGVYSLMWSNPVPGRYSLRAEAVDDAGGRGASAPVQVAVNGVTNNCQVSITVPPGFSMIANQCNNTNVGGNTLNNLYPGVPAGCKITKWNQAGQVFEPSAVFSGGGWSPNFTLNPGEGAFFENPTASPITLTSSGATPTPNLPLALPSSGCSIVSRQQPLVGGYNDIVGLAPQPGDLVFRFVSGSQAYLVYVFDEFDLTWTRDGVPDAPMANVGESIWVCRGVAPPSPNGPVVNWFRPTNGASFAAGSTILLTAQAMDPDGLSYVEFFATRTVEPSTTLNLGRRLGMPTNSLYTVPWSNAPSGTFQLQAVAVDNVGARGFSDVLQVVVSGSTNSPPTNASPVVHWISPTNGAVFAAGTPILLRASASDAEWSLSSIDFFVGTNLFRRILSPLTNFVYTVAWSNAPLGSHQLSAIVTNSIGTPGFSTPVQISVTGATNSPPTNNVLPVVNWIRPTNGAVLEPGTPTLLTVNATDSDGTISYVEFYAGSNSLGRGINVPTNSNYNLTWTNPPPGVFQLRAEAVDNAGDRGLSSPVQVWVGSPGSVDLGTVEVATIGHRSLSNAVDFLIDQHQSSGGGGVLQSVSVNWDTNIQFKLTVAAPPNMKFMVSVPPGSLVRFGGFLLWESSRSGFSPSGPVTASFADLEGTAPEFTESDAVLSHSHGYFGVVELESTGVSNSFSFTSITLTGTVAPQYTGNGTEDYLPHLESAMYLTYSTTGTNDPGGFVSIVPTGPLPMARMMGAPNEDGVDIMVYGWPGRTHVVECSTDIVTWIQISSRVMPPAGSMTVKDASATKEGSRFYRVVELP